MATIFQCGIFAIIVVALLSAVFMMIVDTLDLQNEVREWVLKRLHRKDGDGNG